jgi:two-component system aerobic respiration control protein ArcA
VEKRINTRNLVQQIERLTRERMMKDQIVDLDEVRRLRQRQARRTILLIEDDDTIRAALVRVLEGEGYRVMAAADGSQLSTLLNDTPLDLIMLDIGLPWINGFELAEMMKSHHDLKDLPLIFLSARTSDEDVKKGFEVGADDYIKKPFDLDKVKRTVKTLITLARE